MPFGDWQFWVVTLCALGAIVFALRGVRRLIRGSKGSVTRTRLTIDGKSAGKTNESGRERS